MFFQLKGVGACGVYRLPRTAEEARKELEEEKRIKNEKLKDEGVDGEAEKDGKTRDEVDGETKGNATSKAKKAVKKKAMKKKPTHHKHHKLISEYLREFCIFVYLSFFFKLQFNMLECYRKACFFIDMLPFI